MMPSEESLDVIIERIAEDVAEVRRRVPALRTAVCYVCFLSWDAGNAEEMAGRLREIAAQMEDARGG